MRWPRWQWKTVTTRNRIDTEKFRRKKKAKVEKKRNFLATTTTKVVLRNIESLSAFERRNFRTSIGDIFVLANQVCKVGGSEKARGSGGTSYRITRASSVCGSGVEIDSSQIGVVGQILEAARANPD